jgi:formyl-CoA transferase
MPEASPLLDGIRVVDLTRVLAGPYCTMMLGDLGADVIKIEAPGRGDDTRHWGPPFTEGGLSAYYLSANRNKRSIAIDLKSDAGLSILRRLIKGADLVVENFKTGTLARLGLDYPALQALRPDVIYCTITGYGHNGPYADRPGYDFIVQALGGFMSVTGPADGEPIRAGVAIADLAAGIFASNAILASLFARERTGQGQRIDISLLDSMVALMSYVASNYLVSGEMPPRLGNAHPNIVPYQSFQAGDDYIAFAIGNDQQWARFCEAVDRPQWANDEMFATNAARVSNRQQVVAMLQSLFAGRPAADWLAMFEQIGIASAPINSMDRVFQDPQVIARGLQSQVVHPTEGTLPLVGSPLRLMESPVSIRLAPPTLGQHTDELLAELGYAQSDIEAWRASGAVA